MVPYDLPMEPEHGRIGPLSEIQHIDIQRIPAIVRRSEYIEQMVGTVLVPRSASQGLLLLSSEEAKRVVVSAVVEDGLWDKWNKKNPDRMVEPGDRILSVNGKIGHDSIVAEMAPFLKTRHVMIFIRKPTESCIVVNHDEGKDMGLEVLLVSGLLFILSVEPSSRVHYWNLKNPDRMIQVFDQIVEVNGVRGDQEVMLKALAEQGNVELLLMTHKEWE